MENPQPWVNGVEHLGKLIIRIHFVGGAVRDVDLRGVLTAEELRTLEADPELLDQVGTRVVWPTGAHLDSAMLSLIHEGYGARAGGWPATAPPQPADAPFPVPPMATGGRSPADWMPPTSSSLSRLEKFDKMVRRFSERAPALAEWWTTAQPRLVGELSGAERRSILRNGRAVAKALSSHLQIFVEQLLEQTGAVDAIAEDAELAALVERAQRWNAIWELQQEQAAAAVFDPLENPQGYRVELEGRLRAVEESTSELVGRTHFGPRTPSGSWSQASGGQTGGVANFGARIMSFLEFDAARPAGKIVATSGGFDPIHPGHISSLQASAAYGDVVVVIVNGDAFLAAKKGKPFQDLATRSLIVSAIRGVDYVVPFEIENDTTVREALRRLRPAVFTKGGDRVDHASIPEWDICQELGIEVVSGVGDDKRWSSSWFLQDWMTHMESRPRPST